MLPSAASTYCRQANMQRIEGMMRRAHRQRMEGMMRRTHRQRMEGHLLHAPPPYKHIHTHLTIFPDRRRHVLYSWSHQRMLNSRGPSCCTLDASCTCASAHGSPSYLHHIVHTACGGTCLSWLVKEQRQRLIPQCILHRVLPSLGCILRRTAKLASCHFCCIKKGSGLLHNS